MNKNLLKKLAAGATTVAMLGSLGTVAFAEETPATGVVKDWQNENALDITSVISTKSTVGSVTNYTVTVNYTGVADGAQVTVLGYLYDNQDTELTAVPTESTIYAVNQEEKSGSTVIKLSSAGEKAVTGNEVLVIKMGSDSAGITAAQAVTVNLASATEQKADLVVNAAPASVNATVSYGAGKTALMGQLPAKVTVTGTRDSDQDDVGEEVAVVWNVDEAWVANNISGMTVTGTLQETAGVVLGTYTTVTATVTVNPLTTAVAADLTVNVPVDTADGDIEALIKAKALGLKLSAEGEAIDTIALSGATVSDISIDLATVGNEGSAKVKVSGTSVKGIFALTDFEATVKLVAVEAGPVGVPGDMDGNEIVDADDAIHLLWHTLFPDDYPLSGDGDVDGSGVLDADDAIYLLWHTLFADDYPLYPTQS